MPLTLPVNGLRFEDQRAKKAHARVHSVSVDAELGMRVLDASSGEASSIVGSEVSKSP